MTMRMPVIYSVTAACLLTAVGGCGHGSVTSDHDRVTAAIKSLGGTQDNLFTQKMIFKPVGAPHFDVQDVYLVPDPDKVGFHIVDSHGNIYRDYQDFLVNNRLPN